MKRNILWLTMLLAAFQYGAAQTAPGKKNKQDDAAVAVKEVIASQHFIFQAQSITPMRGGVWQLPGVYDLRVSKESVVSFLPYFGRVYMMPVTPADGPLRFESKDFEYTAKEKAKGSWEIRIKPKDVHSVQQLLLTVYDNGNATLQVTSNHRQPVSFNGYIVPQKNSDA